MRKKFAAILILGTIIIFFHSLSFCEPLGNKIAPTNFSQALIYSQWILRQKGDLLFSTHGKAGSGNTLYDNMPIKALSDEEFAGKPEVTNTMQPPASTDFPKKDFFLFQNGQPLKEKSSYDFGKIRLTGSNLDSSFNLLSSLGVANYREENNIARAVERFKENDIFKSLGILLELKFNF